MVKRGNGQPDRRMYPWILGVAGVRYPEPRFVTFATDDRTGVPEYRRPLPPIRISLQPPPQKIWIHPDRPSLLSLPGSINQCGKLDLGRPIQRNPPMKWPGISLKTMMFAIAILAADFGFLSNLDYFEGLVDPPFSDYLVVVIGLLPMANIIVLGLPRLLWLGLPRLFRRVRRMPFSIGFQITSWVSSLAVLTVVFLKSEAVIELMNRFIATFYQEPCLTARRIGAPAEPPQVDLFESLCVLLSLGFPPENLDPLDRIHGVLLPSSVARLRGRRPDHAVCRSSPVKREIRVGWARPTISTICFHYT